MPGVSPLVVGRTPNHNPLKMYHFEEVSPLFQCCMINNVYFRFRLPLEFSSFRAQWRWHACSTYVNTFSPTKSRSMAGSSSSSLGSGICSTLYAPLRRLLNAIAALALCHTIHSLVTLSLQLLSQQAFLLKLQGHRIAALNTQAPALNNSWHGLYLSSPVLQSQFTCPVNIIFRITTTIVSLCTLD